MELRSNVRAEDMGCTARICFLSFTLLSLQSLWLDNVSTYSRCRLTTKLEVWAMIKSKRIYFIIFIVASATGCTDLLLGPPPSTTPTAIFDELWHDFDARYSLFDVHNVNWDSLYHIYRPRIFDGMQDSVLAKTIDTLLLNLHDRHVGFSAYEGNKNF